MTPPDQFQTTTASTSAVPVNSYPKTGKRGVPQQFPRRLYEMLEGETEHNAVVVKGSCKTSSDAQQSILRKHPVGEVAPIIEWSPSGRAFKIVDVAAFSSQVLPKYFRTSNFSSFQRNLNLYGFSKVRRGPDADMYAHPSFVRGCKDRLSQLRKCKSAADRKRLAAANAAVIESQFLAPKPDPAVQSNVNYANQASACAAPALAPVPAHVITEVDARQGRVVSPSPASQAQNHHMHLMMPPPPPPVAQPSAPAPATLTHPFASVAPVSGGVIQMQHFTQASNFSAPFYLGYLQAAASSHYTLAPTATTASSGTVTVSPQYPPSKSPTPPPATSPVTILIQNMIRNTGGATHQQAQTPTSTPPSTPVIGPVAVSAPPAKGNLPPKKKMVALQQQQQQQREQEVTARRSIVNESACNTSASNMGAMTYTPQVQRAESVATPLTAQAPAPLQVSAPLQSSGASLPMQVYHPLQAPTVDVASTLSANPASTVALATSTTPSTLPKSCSFQSLNTCALALISLAKC